MRDPFIFGGGKMGAYEISVKNARDYEGMIEEAGTTKEALKYAVLAAKSWLEAYESTDDKFKREFALQNYKNIKRTIDSLEFKIKSAPAREITASESEPTDYTSLFNSVDPKVTLDDVIGMDELKETLLAYTVYPLERPDLAEKLLKSTTFGVLLYGPPGCGKSYIVEAIAGTAKKEIPNITYIPVKVSDIVSKWFGESEKKIRAMFEYAAEHAPAILFIDEIDGLGRTRDGKAVHSERILTEFLQDFDIIKGKPVIVIGATNRPWKVDAALIRSGRLGNARILVPPPNREARKAMFKYYLSGLEVSQVDYDMLSDLTSMYSSSDIAAVVNNAGAKALIRAAKGGEPKITMQDLVNSINETKPSTVQWFADLKKELKKDIVAQTYPDLVDLVNWFEQNYFGGGGQ